MINRGWNPRARKPNGLPTPKRVELEVMTTKNAQTRQHIYTTHNQHIQHLRRCAIIGALLPPVAPVAINIPVLRTWSIIRRYRHYVA